MSGEAEEFDLLAATYVLGALEAEEARWVEELAARDATVALAIEGWQNRLAPLAALARPVPPPPDLWERIAAAAGLPAEAPPAPDPAAAPATVTPLGRAWRSLAVWRGATAVSALAAAVALVFLAQRPGPLPYAAALVPMGAPGPVFLARVNSDGSLVVRPYAAVQVASGKDMELWALPQGASKPVPLGVLPVIGRTVTMQGMAKPDVQLLISMEPQGGSPTGLPTGPVVYQGVLKRL